MPSHDDTHFNKYTEENEAKHKILGDYLPAYINALKNNVTAFHYIDGFAGRGAYEGGFPGSPVLVLDKVAKANLLPRTSISLVGDYIREQICKPSDVFSEQVYKRILVELETAGEIVVYDKVNTSPVPGDKRKRRNGRPTLGDPYWLRLA